MLTIIGGPYCGLTVPISAEKSASNGVLVIDGPNGKALYGCTGVHRYQYLKNSHQPKAAA